ncbi:BrnA antitoxin family protein [Rhizobium leguminosarum bv. viciae]|uniref:BrnA antitoxin family protein n=1 Tax=Rhizobium leguminosarum bv. viciae TaxID=387 RepID=A0A7G6RL41_RHILV|nr:BrnA antitoxin family protein [Rhizobium leguminosarum bv. viciae]
MAMNIARRYQAAKDKNRAVNKELSRVLEQIVTGTLPKPRKPSGRPPSGKATIAISLRIAPDVLEFYKSTGEGWQTRMNDALRKAA